MNNKELGNKLREFRENYNLSQLQAEISLDLSQGSLSRIESGKVNPSKETLIKFIDLYNINAVDAAEMFGIEIGLTVSDILKLSNKLHTAQNINELMQFAVDGITQELDLLCSAVCLLDPTKNKLVPQTFTNDWYSPFVKKILGKPLNTYYLDMNFDYLKQNLVKPVKFKRIYESTSLPDFMSPALEYKKAMLIQKFTLHKSSIGYPLYVFNQPVGSIMFSTSSNSKNWHNYENILWEFTRALALNIETLKRLKLK